MAKQPDPTELDDRVAAATYVASLAADLALIARRHGLDTLGYILERARMEAESAVRPARGPDR